MTVIADNKKRVTLPTKPGERFDLQAVGQDQFILTRLAPVPHRPAQVKIKKKDGFTVGNSATKLTKLLCERLWPDSRDEF